MESPTACSQDQISSKNGFVVKFYCVPKPGVDYNSSNPEYDYRFIVYEPDLNGNIKTEFGLNIPFIDSKHIYACRKWRMGWLLTSILLLRVSIRKWII